ncbi:MAG TPA: DUF4956 domain-containing protein [Bacteroidales bacterium]|nr:DUF4956 domain-containing protein [Bacteroidales bacterium]HPS18375.1 DUF4956 domain-containing protein [Bacteroidales bacterium]
MRKIKFVFTCFLFMLLCMPATISVKAQMPVPTDETVQTTTTDDTNASNEKKKKDKDVIEITDKFFYNLGINLASILLIILLVYYPNYRKMEYIFTYFMFNIVIYLLTYVLNEVKISMGAAFGLFAVFSMLRYRTEGISMKDMTYLFIFIGMGLISAIQLEYYELSIINGILIIVTYIMDGNLIFKKELSKSVQYENIELIRPERHTELIEDLKKRTGLNIQRITIRKIDFLRDVAVVRIYYYEK